MVIKSPLNYSGSKNYIVDQIVKYIPSNLDTFVDCMGGAFNVGINVNDAKLLVYNEYNPFVYEMVKMLLNSDSENLIYNINRVIDYFSLSSGNKEKYLELRNYYNKNKHPLLLYVLQMYCFQNQLRFNSKHDFNTPVGNGAFNETTVQRINDFSSTNKVIKTTNLDCLEIDINLFSSNTLFYFDPPYLITNAAYNDGKRGFKGWDEEQEVQLLEFLDKINNNKQKFMLSNVIYHNGKTNHLLLNWAKSNNYNIIELIPHNGRYGARKEVLIVNYNI